MLGPIPWVQMEPNYESITIATAFTGAGYGSLIVSSYTRAFKAASNLGFAQEINTSLMISGLWSMFFYLSTCIGPTLAGFMVEQYGFRFTTLIFVILFILILLVNVVEFIHTLLLNRRREGYRQIEE